MTSHSKKKQGSETRALNPPKSYSFSFKSPSYLLFQAVLSHHSKGFPLSLQVSQESKMSRCTSFSKALQNIAGQVQCFSVGGGVLKKLHSLFEMNH